MTDADTGPRAARAQPPEVKTHMPEASLARLAPVALGGLIALVLGSHGLRHPGPLAATPTGGLAVSGSTRAPATPPRTAGHATTPASGRTPAASTAPPASAPPGLTTTRTKLSQSPYGPYAVAVYPTRSSQATQALDGFTLNVVAGSGAGRTVEISVPGGGVVFRQAIGPSDRVYFIEGSMSDDAPGQDVNGGDDGVIITNSTGYILK